MRSRVVACALALAIVAFACGAAPVAGAPATGTAPTLASASLAVSSPVPTFAPSASASDAPIATARPTAAAPSFDPCPGAPRCALILSAIDQINPFRLDDHLRALTSFISRDPRHPGHAKAQAYIKEQLGALGYYGWKIESQRTVYQGIPLENIFATLDPLSVAVGSAGWVLVSAHYDSVANRTPGWRPAVDPAPGADDNATGTAGLLEFARVLSTWRAAGDLRSRIVLAFFDGEELFFKGSGAYMATLVKPYPYKAAINLDMVGFNSITDRLDLLWYTNASAGLRDRVIKVNQTYRIGVAPLNAQYAADGSTIMDAAPFGVAGIPSIALCQRYGENDATFPGNYTFHTVNDTPDKITNKGLWLKAAKLTLAAALELTDEPAQ